MLKERLKNHNIILASGSPRRQQFFKELQLDFNIQLKEIEEIYPKQLSGVEIPIYLAELKAKAFENSLKPTDILVTSDTIVWHNGMALGKPKSLEEAKTMIASLSGATHEVITAICCSTTTTTKTVHHTTQVTFAKLQKEEIDYYVDTYKPLDKAGGYGIQEWIGLIGITKVVGSYYNVVGLPTHLVYETLMALTNS